MSDKSEKRGKKRSKAFYRKSTHGGKKPRGGANVLEPGIKGFLIMCNNNESQAVKESYNILNEYADFLFGPEELVHKSHKTKDTAPSEEDSEPEDIEEAMKKEIDTIKNTKSIQRRFQNVQTRAKNCVFIRSSVDDPVKLILGIMEDIAQKGLKKARFAARMLPIVGTCKANTSDIEKLARDVFPPIFSKDNTNTPSSYTVMFKIRNNNASTCGKTSVIPALTKIVNDINPSVKFSWSDFEVAVLVEVVCTVCCLGIAPSYIRLRKYNLQELSQGPRTEKNSENETVNEMHGNEEVIETRENEMINETHESETMTETHENETMIETHENETITETHENETINEALENETVNENEAVIKTQVSEMINEIHKNETCEKHLTENDETNNIDKEKQIGKNNAMQAAVEDIDNSVDLCANNSSACVKLVHEKANYGDEKVQVCVDKAKDI